MERDPGIYDSLAAVLTYPDATFEDIFDRCMRLLDGSEGDHATPREEWVAQLRDQSPEQRKEAYAQSFDMSPKCTLELGWHLFGESYDRGTFLVWMRGKLREFSIAESTDLPDHLRHVLPVLGRLEPEEADRFSTACVLPAMEIIRDGLTESSLYTPLVNTICTWLESRHGPSSHDSTSLPVLTEQHEELLRAEGL